MPTKSTAPYSGPPSWLDPLKELPLSKAPHYVWADVVRECMANLIASEVPVRMAAGVIANMANESARGRSIWYGNAGGWKITRAYAEEYKRKNGTNPYWWKARGNVSSDDPDWCFYRAFDSVAQFLDEWMTHFVPAPSLNPKPYPGYARAGKEFAEGNSRWFLSLIRVGYKGRPSKLRLAALELVGQGDSHPSYREHLSLTQDVLEVWAQLKLGVDPDGAWGPKSRGACMLFQQEHGLQPSGNLDNATLEALKLA